MRTNAWIVLLALSLLAAGATFRPAPIDVRLVVDGAGDADVREARQIAVERALRSLRVGDSLVIVPVGPPLFRGFGIDPSHRKFVVTRPCTDLRAALERAARFVPPNSVGEPRAPVLVVFSSGGASTLKSGAFRELPADAPIRLMGAGLSSPALTL